MYSLLLLSTTTTKIHITRFIIIINICNFQIFHFNSIHSHHHHHQWMVVMKSSTVHYLYIHCWWWFMSTNDIQTHMANFFPSFVFVSFHYCQKSQNEEKNQFRTSSLLSIMMMDWLIQSSGQNYFGHSLGLCV